MPVQEKVDYILVNVIRKLLVTISYRRAEIVETTFGSPSFLVASSFRCFSFILLLYPHVVPSHFSKRLSFLGTDFRFWS